MAGDAAVTTAAATVSPAQHKWDRIYEHRQIGEDAYPGILDDAEHLLPTRGRALDLACGAGAASIFLARRGLEVTAWDISAVAIGKLGYHAARHGLPIRAEVVDIGQTPIPQEGFDVIVVSRYLERSLCARLSQALRPGGLLAYQTFTIEATDVLHMNPAYCLVRGELLGLFHDLRPLLYREDALVGNTSSGLRNEARLVAQKRIPMPGFFAEWVRHSIDGNDPAALSRVIERHRRRLANLDDASAPSSDRIETADAVVVPDGQSPSVRAVVYPKGNFVLPTDMTEPALHRLGRIVEVVEESLQLAGGTTGCRSFIPHPADCRTRRLHVVVDSGLHVVDETTRQMLWHEVGARIRECEGLLA